MQEKLARLEAQIPEIVREIFRGIGQVFFQENALTGICFALGIVISSPIMGLGIVVGAALGTATARVLKFDSSLISAGIYGFNAALVGVATFFFFAPSVSSFGLMLVGCVLATLVTWTFRRFLPLPTYTSPFVITTWLLYFVAPSLGAVGVGPGEPHVAGSAFQAVANGIGQVMFQANIITAILFVVGIALSEWRHAAWVVAASAIGMLVANYHITPEQRTLDPERLVSRFLAENISLGLYGYNATLAAIALFLWRRSLIPALLGILLSVPLTELVPKVGVPALTAPFILATWLVLIFGWIDERFLRSTTPTEA